MLAISMSNGPPPLPHSNLHDHCLQFLLGITVVPREIEDNKTMVMQFFLVRRGWGWGWGKTRCIVVYVKMVNCWVFVFLPFCHSRKIFKDHVVITRVAVGVASWLDQSRINFFYDDSDKYYTLFTVVWLMTLLKLFQDRMAFSLVVVYLFLAQNTIF